MKDRVKIKHANGGKIAMMFVTKDELLKGSYYIGFSERSRKSSNKARRHSSCG